MDKTKKNISNIRSKLNRCQTATRTSRRHSIQITHVHPLITLTNYKNQKVDIFWNPLNFLSMHLIIIKVTAHYETFT